MAAMMGVSSTFCSVLVWNELAFCYDDVVMMERGRDARDELLLLHDPPLVIVGAVRFGSDFARPGGVGSAAVV